MSKLWSIKPAVPAEILSKFPRYSPLVVQLLHDRGITEPEAAETFLHPRYEDLHSPFLFQDMNKAVDRIWQAVNNNEQIFIYGDYDADAVTANAVLQQAFRYLGVEVQSYIPDRFTEGYGLNIEAFEKIKNLGARLVITVDCGTNSVDVAEFCRQNDIDLIITDHHEIIGPVPQAIALINPKNPSDNYPYNDITGVGVAFKLACGILSNTEKVNDRFKEVLSIRTASTDSDKQRSEQPDVHVPGWEKWLLDLVAIGTVADCHSLMGENRILVKFGLTVLAKTRWAGLQALCSSAGIDCRAKMPDTYTLGFVIAPRLNAAGRLEHANIALHLLTERDPVQAIQRAFELEAINSRRQDITARILSEAREQALLYSDRKILVLTGDEWPKGVVGLVAGKIAEEFRKPTLVLEKGAEESTGSARTVGEFNVVDALKHASAYLTRFGGHKQAAGLTLKTKELDFFYQSLLEYAEGHLNEADLRERLELDAELSEADLRLEVFDELKVFEPFGVDNVRPKFSVPGAKVVSFRNVGASQQHLQIQFKVGAKTIAGIGFNLSRLGQNLVIGDTVDVAAELIEDSWNGSSQLKLRVVDVKKAVTDRVG